ncbi:arylsulfatase [Kribbella sp. NPDC059898]|uniref:sulfatase family protein n=1 Tax=Kribbella sp. NPDC059898 TaxID=3346995 RepID=UPI00365C06D4
MTVPNIVVIVADDLGWGDLGCYGAERIPTPNIDALAARGARFTDCHASSAVCSPSRYSLITGRYAWRSPLRRGVLGGLDPSIVEPHRPTIGSILQSTGYATAAFGKWHLGLNWQPLAGTTPDPFATVEYHGQMENPGRDVDYRAPFTGGPLELGFDRFFGISGSLDMPPYCFLDGDRTVGVPDQEKESRVGGQRPGLQVGGWQDDQVDVRVTEEACGWIRDQAASSRPFLAYIAPAAPHRPCVPPDFVRGASGAGPRGDAVCLVDWIVGEVVSTLSSTGVLDDTLLIFTSDNGAPTRYPEDGDVEHHRPNGPWRGQKADIWEAGHRVPLIVSWPTVVAAGTVRQTTVCLTDVIGTIAAATGASLPTDDRDGSDWRWLLEASDPPDEPRLLVHHSFDGLFAVRYGEWKAVLGSGSGGFSEPLGAPLGAGTDAGLLYQLLDDPAETVDRWREQPETVADLFKRGADVCRDPATGYPFAAL